MVAGSGPGNSTWLDAERLQVGLLQESRTLRQLSQETIARSRAARDRARSGRLQREVLRDFALIRLYARQETMPVIEQAKGIVMAQQGCAPGEAFDLLCWTALRANLTMRELATQIVEHVASNGHDHVTPITPGAMQYQRSGTGGPPPAG